MEIYTMCVNPETGRYLAISTDDPSLMVIAGSEDEALGQLVASRPGITVDSVFRVETTESMRRKA